MLRSHFEPLINGTKEILNSLIPGATSPPGPLIPYEYLIEGEPVFLSQAMKSAGESLLHTSPLDNHGVHRLSPAFHLLDSDQVPLYPWSFQIDEFQS